MVPRHPMRNCISFPMKIKYKKVGVKRILTDHFAKTQSEAQEEMTTYGLQSYPQAELLTVCMLLG